LGRRCLTGKFDDDENDQGGLVIGFRLELDLDLVGRRRRRWVRRGKFGRWLVGSSRCGESIGHMTGDDWG
jgi:hypothetical protein